MHFEELLDKKTVETCKGVYDYSLVVEAMNTENNALYLTFGGVTHNKTATFIDILPYIILISGIASLLSVIIIKKFQNHTIKQKVQL